MTSVVTTNEAYISHLEEEPKVDGTDVRQNQQIG